MIYLIREPTPNYKPATDKRLGLFGKLFTCKNERNGIITIKADSARGCWARNRWKMGCIEKKDKKGLTINETFNSCTN